MVKCKGAKTKRAGACLHYLRQYHPPQQESPDCHPRQKRAEPYVTVAPGNFVSTDLFVLRMNIYNFGSNIECKGMGKCTRLRRIRLLFE